LKEGIGAPLYFIDHLDDARARVGKGEKGEKKLSSRERREKRRKRVAHSVEHRVALQHFVFI